MTFLAKKTAAITGAGSGIGRALAQRLTREGCTLALADVREDTLRETAELCRAGGARVITRQLDVAQREVVHGWADDVVRELGSVHLIFNNAGVALGATVEDMNYADFEWLMGINFWGVVYGTKAFLPHIKRAGEGAVVNVSSMFGLIGIPTQSAYNAAKFAVRGFTEALREELEIERAKVRVISVHPGGIKTNIARNARTTVTRGMVDANSAKGFELAFITTPERAANQIVDAVLHNKKRVLVGPDAVAVDWVQRLMPVGYQQLVVAGGRLRRWRMLREG